MANNRVLFLMFLVVISFVVASYAAWSERIDYNARENEFKVEFSGYSILTNYKTNKIKKNLINCFVGKIDEKTINVNINIKDLYPGSGAFISAEIRNKGTISSLIDSIEVNYYDNKKVSKKGLKMAIGYIHFDKNNKIKKTGFKIVEVDRLEYNLGTMLTKVKMDPGDYISLKIPKQYLHEVEKTFEGILINNNNCMVFYCPNNYKYDLVELKLNLVISFRKINK